MSNVTTSIGGEGRVAAISFPFARVIYGRGEGEKLS